MDFLANENFPISSIRILRNAGYIVRAVVENFPGDTDSNILKYASESKQVILTFDRDYGELVYKYKLFVPKGVVYFRFDPATPEEPARILLNLIEKNKVPFVDRFTVVERDNIRQRILK